MTGYSDPRFKKERTLYKNPDSAKVCGVCSGIAEYFGFEVWLVRIVTVSLILWLNAATVIAYFALSFILDPKPGSKSTRGIFGRKQKNDYHREYDKNDHDQSDYREGGYDKRNHDKGAYSSKSQPYKTRIKDVWRAGHSPADTLVIIENQLSEIEEKLQRMESYVTSKGFELEREINNIPK